MSSSAQVGGGSSSSISSNRSVTAASSRRIVPWVEKYRPERVDDVSHQEEVVRTLKTAIEQGNIPHVLFYGPPGTGKTTTILAVARALYGPELYRTRILELNASDERGIQVVRQKVKLFAQSAVGSHKTAGYPCPRFKLIILDEADTMTPEAQAALRRIMENYSRVTRFCLICNYVTRIIEPLASRCAKFRFTSLSLESMTSRLIYIAGEEGVNLQDGAVEEILAASGGDMRKAVTYLQSSHQLSGGQPVTPDIVVDITGQLPKEVTAKLWETFSSNSFDVMRSTVLNIVAEGYPLASIISKLHDDVVSHATLQDLDKALICTKLAQVEQCLINGACESLQLMDLSAFIMRRVCNFESAVDKVGHH